MPITDDTQNSWSNSPVSWDPRAFRYLSLGEGIGYLIMPLSSHTTPSKPVGVGEVKPEPEYFEGFVVFSIDASQPNEAMRITRVLDIDHTDSGSFEPGFYYCNSLPERSFVIDGHLITLKAHSIVSTNLLLSEEAWTLELDKDLGGCRIY